MGGAHTLPPSTLNGDRHKNNPGSATEPNRPPSDSYLSYRQKNR